MASLGFPVIASVSSHSTAEHRYAWEIQVRAPGAGKTLCKVSLHGKLREGQSGRRKSISVTIGVVARSFL